MSLAKDIIKSHLVSGKPHPGEEIAITIDQTLTQDATGTLVMLELEALGIDRVETELSAQYVDHNLLQLDAKNADDHRFLRSACRRYGVWYSAPGNGISHVVHQEYFGRPGRTLLGSDSHTPAAGSIGMLAIGAGGLDVALAMAGHSFSFVMPEIVGVEVTGRLQNWVSAKDVILEMLRRYGVRGGRNKIFEYYGTGLRELSVMDRHVIANMGTEMGATTSLFPSDAITKQCFAAQKRPDQWQEAIDTNHDFEHHDQLRLDTVIPMVAIPSPGDVRSVTEVQSQEIGQSYIGSSANPGYRDFAIAAHIVEHRVVHPGVSFDINPTSRQVLATLTRDGLTQKLMAAGARFHQTGCNGCIGMGQAPATDAISLRTVPRNFLGRSGTMEDQVYLVSPETAAASALTGKITDPRYLDKTYPHVLEPDDPVLDKAFLEAPLEPHHAKQVQLHWGPNIKRLPKFAPVPEHGPVPILLQTGDDISTDDILPAGAKILPLRSNIEKISEYVFHRIDRDYVSRTKQGGSPTPHIIIAGENYGQGSSREHAAIAPRYLGLVAVIANSFARIHRQNLVNFGVLPLTFIDNKPQLEPGDTIDYTDLYETLRQRNELELIQQSTGATFMVRHQLSPRQVEIIIAGGLINWLRQDMGQPYRRNTLYTQQEARPHV